MVKRGFIVGLVGESPNDVASVQALLGQRYGERIQFVNLSREVTGSQLDNPKTRKIVITNYRFEKPDLIVVSRDLDALETDRAKRLERLLSFRKLNNGLERKAIFLLNVQAIEALIIADLTKFNERYKCACPSPGDPMMVVDPVSFLKQATPSNQPAYTEGNCAGLLTDANYERIVANCRYFAKFDAVFAASLPAL